MTILGVGLRDRGLVRRPGPRIAACSRCLRTAGVISDDGRPVCIVCILAWGSYARLVARAEPEVAPTAAPVTSEARRDPTIAAFLHWSHRSPVPGCPLCVAAA